MSRQITTPGKVTLNPQEAAARCGGKLLFTTYRGQKTALLLKNDRLISACFFPRTPSKIGAVYICKVKNVVKNLNAYFVEIGGEEHEICFLSQKDAAYPFLLNRPYDGRILEGDEFPVQVTKDAQKTKQASVTTLISLSNAYFALSVGNPKTGYSNKLLPQEKERLRQHLQNDAEKLTIPKPLFPMGAKEGFAPNLSVGLVIRTQAAQLSDEKERLLEEWAELTGAWERLFQAAVHRTCFSCLLDAPLFWEAALDGLAYPYEYEEILTDDGALYGQLTASATIPRDKTIRFYDEKQSEQLSLSALFGLESKLETALGRRVWLKSGGYLVIDPTEALTVIDVNSGKCESGKNAEDTYELINREAAQEIALQLRLRNLSGMILVDFINQKSKERQDALLEYLRAQVQNDKQKTVVVDMTPLGLVEITRKKTSPTLAQQFEQTKEHG